MKSLLTDLNAVGDKTAYQSYTLQHGIEKMAVLVPLRNAKVFEEAFAKADRSKSALLDVIAQHSGKIKG